LHSLAVNRRVAGSNLARGANLNPYDGDSRRVSKSNGKLYWYASGGEILAEIDASGTTPADYIFFAGQRIAMLPAGANPIYYVEDLLGTSRVTTTNAGVVCYDADYYPYGGERTVTNTCTQNNYKFEGKERDTETGNDDFGARYNSNRFGRWLRADWSNVPVAVPYANLTNPQTLDVYSMVADDPESFADLDGHKQAVDNPGTGADGRPLKPGECFGGVCRKSNDPQQNQTQTINQVAISAETEAIKLSRDSAVHITRVHEWSPFVPFEPKKK
jgi:RHS repeat-associated protein